MAFDGLKKSSCRKYSELVKKKLLIRVLLEFMRRITLCKETAVCFQDWHRFLRKRVRHREGIFLNVI